MRVVSVSLLFLCVLYLFFSTSVSLHFYGVSVSFALSVSMLLCGICFFSSLVSVSFLCVTMCASV